ncbi:DUF3761 domain-containing protein [Paraburkholderia sp. DHOC27]|uniref:DUF3761 domain-containing protein n=1 Tax=Paraburkholderia sp. DHOC27 TaxID=2303330 RepID=UPI000E3C90AF|nr:DUF3761 domain-containing protein [Paraburkholderia sp. DHOC27]RFU43987.1 DUF3761 domain-containing protein [Paraburkholderia sp. DHOC27]
MIVTGVTALLFAAAPAFAYVGPDSTADEANLSNHRAYINHGGQLVHAPARSLSGEVPEGATARCRDGSYSFSRHHSGTCSRHGGVAAWL